MQFFGRVASDYEAMFAIKLPALKGLRVLDCPSGPGSFVAEANAQGVHVVGVDPLYELPLEQLVQRGSADVAHTIEQMQANARQFADINLQAYALAVAERFASEGLQVRYDPSTFARGNVADDALNACMVITR